MDEVIYTCADTQPKHIDQKENKSNDALSQNVVYGYFLNVYFNIGHNYI